MEPPIPPAPPPMAPPVPNPTPYTAPEPGGAYPKADPVKRFVAVFIDSCIAGIPAFVFSAIFAFMGLRGVGLGLFLMIGGAYMLVRDGLAYDFADGRSVGKKIMKLRPVRLDGGAMDMDASIRRNWSLAAYYFIYGIAALLGGVGMFVFAGLLGIIAWVASVLWLVEGILVLTDKDGRRFAEKMANTQVIEVGD